MMKDSVLAAEENVTRDIRQNLIDPIAGPSFRARPAAPIEEHERITINLPSASTSAVVSPREENANLLENASLLTTLSVERAASLFSTTGAAMIGMGQHFLSVPPAVWNGLVLSLHTLYQYCN